jgi:hypothetical protein
MYDKCLLVISYYDRHPLSNLTELLQSILQYPAGGEFDVCIIVNRTKEDQITLPDEYSSIPVRYRYNIGMNIGAWDHGWRQCPNYRDYLFMQDECYVIRDQWLAGFRSALQDPKVGMVGESLNNGWSRPWAELRKNFEALPMPGHFINGRAANRVDCYLDFLHRNQVQPGKTARHLRSVVWFFPGAVLKKIDGFLIGRNYGECIAAEIATSKKVESIGLDITQAREEEFFYIRHLEYNQDRPGAAYTHDVNYVSYASVRKLIEARKGNSWNVLRLKLQRHLRLRPVKFFK